ncbi:MAG TPA: efflux RND transporter periplasmic adaptor subunit, partial [Planctomycetota bacterium]|nr:efflux RND transporter periplasmic adaptor subunit [Planctomycetota bacterium]
MKSTSSTAPILLLAMLALLAVGLAAWKRASIAEADAVAASQPEPMETVTAATTRPAAHVRTSSAIGTVLALRSITLRNELAGKVATARLTPGQVVEEGTVLVAQDVSVEEAELKAEEAQVALAESTLGRLERASLNNGASAREVDQARAQRDVELAEAARIRALIERKTLRAPFRARIGLSDVHVGQYLEEGTEITTLQGVDDAVHVDFSVPQQVAAGLREGGTVAIRAASGAPATPATIVALDSRVDPRTRNAWVRARIDGAGNAPTPGASVQVQVPVGEPQQAVAIPVNALRKGP